MIYREEFNNWTKVNIDDRNSLFRKTIKDYGWSVYGGYSADTYELTFINSDVKVDSVYVVLEFLDPFHNPCTYLEEPFNLGVINYTINKISMGKGKIITNMNELSSHLFTLLDVFVADVVREPCNKLKEDIVDGLLGDVVF